MGKIPKRTTKTLTTKLKLVKIRAHKLLEKPGSHCIKVRLGIEILTNLLLIILRENQWSVKNQSVL
jgi:hypothetical protein